SSGRVGRTALISIGSLASKYSPGTKASPYGLMDGHELGAIRKRAFHLDLADHVAHTVYHGVARKNRRPNAYDLGDRLAIADELEELSRDQCNGLRMVELQAAGAPFFRELTGAEDDELVDLAWSQMHERILICRRCPAARVTARRLASGSCQALRAVVGNLCAGDLLE